MWKIGFDVDAGNMRGKLAPNDDLLTPILAILASLVKSRAELEANASSRVKVLGF